MTDNYAVFGNPIQQSKSPQIHALFAEQFALDLLYTRKEVALDGFDAAAAAFFQSGGKGLNITTPFKHDAYSFANQLTARARRAGAVNTLAVGENGEIIGDTTDGVGFVRDLCKNLGWQVSDKRLLIIGAGGAVRGVLEAILGETPAELVVANRTVSKAESLAKGFVDFGNIRGCGLDQLADRDFDLVINGTSASLAGESVALPEALFANTSYCYDMAYAPEPTPFLTWAAPFCESASDGLGMLVEQAAESFQIWTKKRPDTNPVIEHISQLIRPS